MRPQTKQLRHMRFQDVYYEDLRRWRDPQRLCGSPTPRNLPQGPTRTAPFTRCLSLPPGEQGKPRNPRNGGNKEEPHYGDEEEGERTAGTKDRDLPEAAARFAAPAAPSAPWRRIGQSSGCGTVRALGGTRGYHRSVMWTVRGCYAAGSAGAGFACLPPELLRVVCPEKGPQRRSGARRGNDVRSSSPQTLLWKRYCHLQEQHGFKAVAVTHSLNSVIL